MAGNGNSRLDQAFSDLDAVYEGNKERSVFSTEVNNAINALKALTDPWYESGESMTDEALGNILDGYKALMEACEKYINTTI